MKQNQGRVHAHSTLRPSKSRCPGGGGTPPAQRALRWTGAKTERPSLRRSVLFFNVVAVEPAKHIAVRRERNQRGVAFPLGLGEDPHIRALVDRAVVQNRRCCRASGRLQRFHQQRPTKPLRRTPGGCCRERVSWPGLCGGRLLCPGRCAASPTRFPPGHTPADEHPPRPHPGRFALFVANVKLHRNRFSAPRLSHTNHGKRTTGSVEM